MVTPAPVPVLRLPFLEATASLGKPPARTRTPIRPLP